RFAGAPRTPARRRAGDSTRTSRPGPRARAPRKLSHEPLAAYADHASDVRRTARVGRTDGRDRPRDHLRVCGTATLAARQSLAAAPDRLLPAGPGRDRVRAAIRPRRL